MFLFINLIFYIKFSINLRIGTNSYKRLLWIFMRMNFVHHFSFAMTFLFLEGNKGCTNDMRQNMVRRGDWGVGDPDVVLLLVDCKAQWRFRGGFHGIKYHQFCWHGKEREGWSFIVCEESFINMKLIWYSYLVLSLGSCAFETLTDTGRTARLDGYLIIGQRSSKQVPSFLKKIKQVHTNHCTGRLRLKMTTLLCSSTRKIK